jgi:predicted transcriptional regulator
MGRSGNIKTPGKYGRAYQKQKSRPKPKPGEKRPVVISFTPDSSEEILNAEEAIELRRHSAGCENGTPVVIYTSGKVRKVEGSCVVEELICDEPESLWERGVKDMGLTKEDYDAYFEGAKKAYAFILTDIKKVDPFPLPFPGPRSFRYLYDDIAEQKEILQGASLIEEENPSENEETALASE